MLKYRCVVNLKHGKNTMIINNYSLIHKRIAKFFIIGLAVGFSTSYGATETTSFSVTATVTDVCQNLTANNINFGAYNPLTASNTDASGDIHITCTNNTSYSVALSSGGSGSYSTRQLSDGGSNSLNYNLYTSSNHNTVFGDGTGSSDTVNQIGSGSQDTITVYGRIPAGQSVANASYSDTINVTVTY